MSDISDRCNDLPPRAVGVPDTGQGLFQKFEVRRTDGSSEPGGKHEGCEYFVLDTDHDTYAKVALAAYADACERTHPLLARDLRLRHHLPENEHVVRVPIGINFDAERTVGWVQIHRDALPPTPDWCIAIAYSVTDRTQHPSGRTEITGYRLLGASITSDSDYERVIDREKGRRLTEPTEQVVQALRERAIGIARDIADVFATERNDGDSSAALFRHLADQLLAEPELVKAIAAWHAAALHQVDGAHPQAAQPEAVAWISPAEKVPRGGEVVLCLFRDKGIHTAKFRGTSTTHGSFDAWHGFLTADVTSYRVIGWLPLDTPPTEPACQPTLTVCPRCKNDFRACPMTQAEPAAASDTERLSELMRGLEIPPGANLTPQALYCIGAAIADQAKEAVKPAAVGEPVTVWGYSEQEKSLGHRMRKLTDRTDKCDYCGAMVNDCQNWPGETGGTVYEPCRLKPCNEPAPQAEPAPSANPLEGAPGRKYSPVWKDRDLFYGVDVLTGDHWSIAPEEFRAALAAGATQGNPETQPTPQAEPAAAAQQERDNIIALAESFGAFDPVDARDTADDLRERFTEQLDKLLTTAPVAERPAWDDASATERTHARRLLARHCSLELRATLSAHQEEWWRLNREREASEADILQVLAAGLRARRVEPGRVMSDAQSAAAVDSLRDAELPKAVPGRARDLARKLRDSVEPRSWIADAWTAGMLADFLEQVANAWNRRPAAGMVLSSEKRKRTGLGPVVLEETARWAGGQFGPAGRDGWFFSLDAWEKFTTSLSEDPPLWVMTSPGVSAPESVLHPSCIARGCQQSPTCSSGECAIGPGGTPL